MIVHPKFVFAHLEKTGGMFTENILINSGGRQLDNIVKKQKLPQDVICYTSTNDPPCRHDALYRYLSQ